MSRWWSAFAVLLAPWACSTSSSGGGAPAVDAAIPDASTDDAGEDGATEAAIDAPSEVGEGGTCTPIANVGSAVASTFVAAAAPAGGGGQIAPGTYALTKLQIY